jgi:outer membrane protein OmpA-like peptidoglycan-associated protein
MSSRRLDCLAAACAAFALGAAGGPAGADEFDVENFHPVSPGDGELMAVHTTRQAPSGQLAMGLSFGVVDDPLVVVDGNDDRIGDVVSRRASTELSAAFGLGRLEVMAAMPFILAQSQNSATDPSALGVAAVDSGGIGDARIGARGFVLGGTGEGVGVGGGLIVTLPTSVNAEFAGDSGPTAVPYLVADYTTEMFVAAANLGGRIRQTESLGMEEGALEVGSALTYGGGAGVRALPGATPIWVLAELAGEVGGGDAAEAPLEVRGGLRADIGNGFVANAGYGRGLVHGYGAPDHRFLAALTYRPEEPHPERIVVQQVAVAQPPENPDRDGDGIVNDSDSCPDDAEDFDGFEDKDGCPETDNDKDSIADASDGCPNNAEDFDKYQDEDGCPDPDNDFDGITDTADKCPNEAEVINGNADDDGCPDEGKKLVLIGQSKLEIQDKVYFALNKADILPRSDNLLNQIAKTLERHPWIKKVRIEGHTDDVGKDAYNLDLSNRRAKSVLDALVKRGVVVDRLESVGYGETQPIDSNKTLEGRAHNRRVEFVILEQDPHRPPAEPGTAAQPLPTPTKKPDDGVKGGAK